MHNINGVAESFWKIFSKDSIEKETTMSEKPRPQAPPADRDLL